MLVATSNVDETELEISDDMLERIESHATVTLKKIPQDDSSTSDTNPGQLQLADPVCHEHDPRRHSPRIDMHRRNPRSVPGRCTTVQMPREDEDCCEKGRIISIFAKT